MRQILHAYTSTWNDLYMVRYYVRHWAQFASKIFVYDDDSTDGTREYLESMAPLVEIKSPGFHGLDQLLLQKMRSEEYRIHSRGVADWVVIGDSDELHWHPNMLEMLSKIKAAGIAAVVSQGYQMFSPEAPDGEGLLTDHIKEGIRDHMYDRPIFRPELDVTIGIGLHGFTIDGDNGSVNFGEFQRAGQSMEASPDNLRKMYAVIEGEQDFKMLHYQFIGEEHIKERHARVWSRLSDSDKEHKWGIHTSPEWGDYYSLGWYKNFLQHRKKVI